MKLRLKLILLVGVLSGCGTTLTKEQIEAADYGQPQSQAVCEAKAAEKVKASLKDPESARFEFGVCEKKYYPGVVLYGIPRHFGYGMQFTVNAKNSFGGYVGKQNYLAVINNGNVIRCIRFNKKGLPEVC